MLLFQRVRYVADDNTYDELLCREAIAKTLIGLDWVEFNTPPDTVYYRSFWRRSLDCYWQTNNKESNDSNNNININWPQVLVPWPACRPSIHDESHQSDTASTRFPFPSPHAATNAPIHIRHVNTTNTENRRLNRTLIVITSYLFIYLLPPPTDFKFDMRVPMGSPHMTPLNAL